MRWSYRANAGPWVARNVYHAALQRPSTLGSQTSVLRLLRSRCTVRQTSTSISPLRQAGRRRGSSDRDPRVRPAQGTPGSDIRASVSSGQACCGSSLVWSQRQSWFNYRDACNLCRRARRDGRVRGFGVATLHASHSCGKRVLRPSCQNIMTLLLALACIRVEERGPGHSLPEADAFPFQRCANPHPSSSFSSSPSSSSSRSFPSDS